MHGIIYHPIIRVHFQGGQYTDHRPSMAGKVCIVTGCNTGIGKETVRNLVLRGATVYMACRDSKNCEKAQREISNQMGSNKVHCRQLDLASLQSVREFASRYL